MQCWGRSMSLVRGGGVERYLHRLSLPASHNLHLDVSLQPLRKLSNHLAPFTTSIGRLPSSPPSGLKDGVTRRYSVHLDDIKYEQVSEETLESLSEYLEELVASDTAPQDCDVLYSTGVLTLHLGTSGTYVINKQAPNKQIWLSSPTSGPKRFDFLAGVWVYHHTGETLHGLLTQELSRVLSVEVDFSSCAYGSVE